MLCSNSRLRSWQSSDNWALMIGGHVEIPSSSSELKCGKVSGEDSTCIPVVGGISPSFSNWCVTFLLLLFGNSVPHFLFFLSRPEGETSVLFFLKAGAKWIFDPLHRGRLLAKNTLQPTHVRAAKVNAFSINILCLSVFNSHP